jgi:ABC-type bacteriocin/lantibiotic exporter with double-glycine peptidase domain
MPAPWLNVPHHKQRGRADCLAACAAMALAYHGVSIKYSHLLLHFQHAQTGMFGSKAQRLKPRGYSA